ncbi:Chloramphenicol acetyltransferase 2 [uncultured Eubacterium sp.]|nr:Chloramphenicol acetyltransferase 2 [uncultured Eubacterium sp.]
MTVRKRICLREIDFATWSRAHLFKQYQGADLPYIIISAPIDVTKLLKWSREKDVSFYFALVHTATQIADKIENFHYRFDGDKILRIDHNIPLLTHMRKGEELFIMLEGMVTADRLEFCRDLRAKANDQNYNRRETVFSRHDMISFSCMPWIDYTQFVRTIIKDGEDNNPKLSWGKYTTDEQGRTTLNFSVQVHHGLMDGYHVGMFYQELQNALNTLK